MTLLSDVKIFGPASQNNDQDDQPQTKQVILDLVLRICSLEMKVF